MLKDPFLNEAFKPSLMWFVGVLDVYDREETKGVELEVFDPNDSAARESLIRNYFLDLKYLSYKHRLVLLEALELHLMDSSFDFQSLFEIDESEAACWPRAEWYELEDPRGFFEALYKIALEEWAEDLAKAASEDRSTW